uniref:Uncharacterized protein n=1 Tax=Anopheles braziliensis TaxID=58242 RepID=A0A2M3ZM05_9DIPT
MMTTVSVALGVAVPIAVTTVAMVVYTERILHAECRDKSGESEGETLEQEGDQARTVSRELGDVVAPHFVPQPRILQAPASQGALHFDQFRCIGYLVDRCVRHLVRRSMSVPVSHIVRRIRCRLSKQTTTYGG